MSIPDPKNQVKKNRFIPASESEWLTGLFSRYIRWLFMIRFKRIWLKQAYYPGPDSRTIYYLNHSSWWDGILPLLLNQYLFHQKGRAMMEDKQMNRYRFFRRIGAFSVRTGRGETPVQSLRYALRSMQRENSSLYIYPEGKMVPFTTEKPVFRKGLAWLYRQLPDVDVVPVGVYIQNLRYSKPELHIQIGEPVRVTSAESSATGDFLGERLEQSLQRQLSDLQRTGGFDDEYFKRWF